MWWFSLCLVILVQCNIWWVFSCPPTVPQPQPESRPEEHYVEQQARLHHPNSHLLLHWPLLLPDDHWWRCTQVTYILCTQTRSAVHTFLFFCKLPVHSDFYICIYIISDMIFFLVTVSNITAVYLNSSGPVEALKGERLVLNCTATGELNTRVNITWDYPGKVRPTLKSVEKQRFRWWTIITVFAALTCCTAGLITNTPQVDSLTTCYRASCPLLTNRSIAMKETLY